MIVTLPRVHCLPGRTGRGAYPNSWPSGLNDDAQQTLDLRRGRAPIGAGHSCAAARGEDATVDVVSIRHRWFGRYRSAALVDKSPYRVGVDSGAGFLLVEQHRVVISHAGTDQVILMAVLFDGHRGGADEVLEAHGLVPGHACYPVLLPGKVHFFVVGYGRFPRALAVRINGG